MTGNLNASAEAEMGKAYNRSPTRTGRIGICRVLSAAEICILIGVIVLFNAFPERVGIYSSAMESYLFVPLLAPAWLPFMPWLNLWWGLALTLALVKLVYGRWTQALRWADLGVHLLSICVLASAILGHSFASPTGLQQNADLLLVGFKSCLVLVLVAQIVGLFTKLAKLGITIPVLQWRVDWFKR